uniref:Uncharacterized protein n=1 Tax=Globisporangium ultimum (strain ATCC 200006 / CBS 805.95 / DAOM BR144) TaxID=431595 RepID=K3XAZ4_GLOUD
MHLADHLEVLLHRLASSRVEDPLAVALDDVVAPLDDHHGHALPKHDGRRCHLGVLRVHELHDVATRQVARVGEELEARELHERFLDRGLADALAHELLGERGVVAEVRQQRLDRALRVLERVREREAVDEVDDRADFCHFAGEDTDWDEGGGGGVRASSL